MSYYNADDPVREIAPQGVEPVREFRMSDGTTIRPGRSRFSLDHDWVVSNPENFRPIAGCTKLTRERFRDMLARTERMLERGQAPPRASSPRTARPSSRPRPLRLP